MFENFCNPEVFSLTERTTFFDAHEIANVRILSMQIHKKLGTDTVRLFIQRVEGLAVDGHRHGACHLRRSHDALLLTHTIKKIRILRQGNGLYVFLREVSTILSQKSPQACVQDTSSPAYNARYPSPSPHRVPNVIGRQAHAESPLLAEDPRYLCFEAR